MFRGLQQYRTWLFVSALLVIPLLVYRAHVNKNRDANLLDKGIFLLTSPVQELLTNSTDFIARGWYTYVDLVDARKDIIELRLRLGELEREVNRIENIEDENFRLQKLLSLRQSNQNVKSQTARVISHHTSGHSLGLRISRGLVDGVVRGMPVVDADGLVGRVQRVGFGSADVVFAVDSDFSVDGIVVGPGVRGRLRGDGVGDKMSFKLTREARADALKVGDRIVTSGLGGVFPPNIDLGKITQLEIKDGKPDSIFVTPNVDFDSLRTVMIILHESHPTEPWVTPPNVLPETLKPTDIPAPSDADLLTRTSTR